MKDNIDNNLDELIGKVLKQVPLESPSKEFTTNILSKIEGLPQSTVFVYKPLISKNVWIVISLIILGVMGYMFYGPTVQESVWLSAINLEKLPSIKLPKFISGLAFSKTFSYSIFALATLLLIQIPMLKKNFDKRLGF